MTFFPKHKLALVLTCIAASVSACAPSGGSGDAANASAVQSGPLSIARGTRAFSIDVLLYNGAGAWSAEVPSIQNILDDHGATYRTVSSSQLNAMTLDELAQYGAIVFPGGYGNQITDSLSTATQERLRRAVRERGLNYVGFCAGSFIAVAPTPPAGQKAEYGLSIVDGARLTYYYLEEEFVKAGRESQDWAMTKHSFADGTTRDILWYGGPTTPNIPGHVVARYPNGDAAISQMWSGNGLVVLAATHPTATNSVLNTFGLSDSDGLDHDIAWKLIEAAITQNELPVF